MEPNSILLAVLLHLGTIGSPGTYTTCTISQIEQANHTQVVQTMNNTPLMNYIIAEYGDETQLITVNEQECN
ncbi:MAG: hypothetical protein JNL32_04225 [Candidatus Kapabacteria bacterium]|nr:hypothetical protein [Candidatus Kapabacteria bacterium]